MYKLLPTIFFTSLISLPSLTSASGIPLVVSPGLNISTNPSIPAHLPPCTNLTAANAPSIPCYTKLNTTGYFDNYDLIKAETCAPSQAWTSCLLTTIYQVSGTNCTTQAPGVERCIPFDCATLNSTTCVQPRNTNRTDIDEFDAKGWYAAFTIYNTHAHISAWALALNAPSSEPAILSALNPRVPNTPTSVLKTLFAKYSPNPNADNAIIALLEKQNAEPGRREPAYGNARRVRGERSTLSGGEWRRVLYGRLEEGLGRANFYEGGEEEWRVLVREGAFATRGLMGREGLVERLKKG